MKNLYKPKITKGFGCEICGIFLPKNTMYMRLPDGYAWVSAYDVWTKEHFTVNFLTTHNKHVRQVYVDGEKGIGKKFKSFVYENKIRAEKPVQVVNRRTLGELGPKNVMVSKAYAACAVYAGSETKTKKSIEWRM